MILHLSSRTVPSTCKEARSSQFRRRMRWMLFVLSHRRHSSHPHAKLTSDCHPPHPLTPSSTTAPVSTPATGDEPSPAPAAVAPTPEPEATLSPNADDLCTDACTNNPSGDDFSSFYYDERCEGKTSADLSGCNLGTDLDGTLENCRRCTFNVAESETGSGGMRLLLCRSASYADIMR